MVSPTRPTSAWASSSIASLSWRISSPSLITIPALCQLETPRPRDRSPEGTGPPPLPRGHWLELRGCYRGTQLDEGSTMTSSAKPVPIEKRGDYIVKMYELEEDVCRRMLAGSTFGRVAFTD